MLPLPNYEPPTPPPPPWQPPPVQEFPASPDEVRGSPRVKPLILWFLWLGLTSLFGVMIDDSGPNHRYLEILHIIFMSNMLLTPAWAALAIRPIMSHVASLLLVYLFLVFNSTFLNDEELFLIFPIVFVTWSLLRWGRVLTLDLQLPPETVGSRTPRLAERIQFSLWTLILMSVVVALGISLYLFFQESYGWQFYKVMFFLAVPSELLIFWGTLGRAPWYLRLPWLAVAIHHWLLLDVLVRGFKSWEEIYHWNEASSLLSFPISQIIGLTILRCAGYRFGIPKAKAVPQLPVAALAEPQSPWDE